MFGITFRAVARAGAANLSLPLTSQLLVGDKEFSICFLLVTVKILRNSHQDPQVDSDSFQ